MKTTILADYKARTSTNSKIHIEANDVPLRVHQMVVWLLMHKTPAELLLPEYDKLRDWWEAEGSAKNVGVEP